MPSYLLGAGFEWMIGKSTGFISEIGALSMILAYPFAVSYGVYIIGNIGIEDGSYWSTFWGTLGGIGSAIGIAVVASKLDDNKTLYTVASFCPSVGAIIGFNSSRRLESNYSTFKVEQNKYSILKPDFSMQLFRINF